MGYTALTNVHPSFIQTQERKQALARITQGNAGKGASELQRRLEELATVLTEATRTISDLKAVLDESAGEGDKDKITNTFRLPSEADGKAAPAWGGNTGDYILPREG